ncbi:unnamed protein product [Linum trigynum]
MVDSHLNFLRKNGRLSEAVEVLDALAQDGTKVNSKTLIGLLQSCIDSNAVDLGRKIHARISLAEEKSAFLETKLVGMYAKCGCLRDARMVFDEMRERNLYTWSAMIGACCRDQRWKEVVGLFHMMMADGILADGFLLPKILQACGNCGDFRTGKLLHSLVVKCGMGDFPRVNNSILAVYAKCGELGLARKFFDGMDDKTDRVAWNALISGYCQKGEIKEAHRLFDAMCKEGVEPGLVTWNILITGYNQIGQCDVAMELMEEMVRFGIEPDVVAWTAMISGYAQNNRQIQALDLFEDMISSGVEPNGVTIATAISACSVLKLLNNGMAIHALAVEIGCTDDVLVGNALIDFYSKCEKLEASQLVFDCMPEKDVFTWNSMIGGYIQAGYSGKANELFTRMQNSEIQPDVITWNTMISGYIENGDEDEATDLFHKMEKDGKIKRDTASWNSLIAGYLHIGQKQKALCMFRQMQSSGFSPNAVTILSVLPACANLVALKKVKEIHGIVLRRNLEAAVSIPNSLIDTYAKSGKLVYSRSLFDRMKSKDFITWNSIIAAYVLHGCSDEALSLVEQMLMLGLKPERSTFVNIILAHSLNENVEEGKHILTTMIEDDQLNPAIENYAAMVDLYGRAGRLEEAIRFIEAMPVKPDSSVWSRLLTACRVHGCLDLGIHAGERLLNLEPGNALISHLVLQAYALRGTREDTFRLQRLQNEHQLPKLIGESWIESKNKMHSFVSGDRSKPYSNLLFAWIDRISIEDKGIGRRQGLCIGDEEKEEIVGVHSEKLALAFAFVCSQPVVPRSIRIVKNLRMCSDCHRMAKHISLKYGCEIYLSHPKCFHHFKDGHCSCGDYW